MGIIHTVKAKNVDVIEKGELAREQRKMRKEHLENTTLREAKERPLERGERKQLKREPAQRTNGGQGGVWSTGLYAGDSLRSISF